MNKFKNKIEFVSPHFKGGNTEVHLKLNIGEKIKFKTDSDTEAQIGTLDSIIYEIPKNGTYGLWLFIETQSDRKLVMIEEVLEILD